MSYWDYNRDPAKVEKQLKRCPICRAKGKLTYRSKMGGHPSDDKVWFKAMCTECDAETWETEGPWSDETAIKRWNSGDVMVAKGTVKRLKEINKLKAENARLRRIKK